MARKSKKAEEASLVDEVLSEEKSIENATLDESVSEKPDVRDKEALNSAEDCAVVCDNALNFPSPEATEEAKSAEENAPIEEGKAIVEALFPEEAESTEEAEATEYTEPIKEAKKEEEATKDAEDNESSPIANEEAFIEAEQIELFEEVDEAPIEAEAEVKEEAPEEKRELTEEEMRDARYLPRPSVIFDENADDAEEIIEDGEEEEEIPEVYSLNFFDDDIDAKTEEAKEEEPEEKELEPYNPKKPRKIDARFDFVELFVFTLVFVLVITSFIFRHSVVVGGSMENTLYEGERLLISDLFYTPDYGDIIVFQDAETGIKGAVVKRIIGLPGDVIEVFENGSIYRNGLLLIEDYIFIDGKNTQKHNVFVVGEGEYFVMGDHRNNSEDSRSFGTIKEDSILGRALLRFYPFDRFGKVE